MKARGMDFTLWIETEHVEEPITDFCNVIVTHSDGSRWGLNVWTYGFFETARGSGELVASSEMASVYMFPPDLFVEDLSRETLERVIGDVVLRQTSLPHWRATSDQAE